MEREGTEWVVAGIGAVAGQIDIDSQLFVLGAVLFQFIPTAGGERQSGAVVNGAPLQVASRGNQTGIVNVTAAAIGLKHQSAFARDGVGMPELNICRLAHD